MDVVFKKTITWEAVPTGLQWCIFMTGVGAGCLQIIFLFMLMLEAPGWLDESGRVKYISDALAVHQGFGAVLILLFLVSNTVIGLSFVNFNVGKIFFYTLLALPISSGFCVVAFTNVDYPDEHLASTMTLFISYAVVVISVLWTETDSLKGIDRGIGLLSIIFVFLFVFLYRQAEQKKLDDEEALREFDEETFNAVHSTAAIFEFLTIFCFIILNVLAPFRVRDHLKLRMN
jgi:hypothetical protein